MELSTMGTRRVKLGLSLEASLEISMAEADEGLAEFYAPVIGPDETFDLTSHFQLNLRKMRWCREQVTETDLEHRKETEKLTELIGERDNVLVPAVGNKLVRMRHVCQGLCDEKELLRLGLEGAVAQDPVLVLRQGQKVDWRFERSEVSFDSETWPEARLEAEALRRALAADVKALDLLLKEIQKQRRRVERAAKRKNRAFEDFDKNYRWIGRTSELGYLMAGMKEEAERARPSTRRLDRNGEEPLPGDPPTGDEPSLPGAPPDGGGSPAPSEDDSLASGAIDLFQDDVAPASGETPASAVPLDPAS